jgi:hypothetical protein
MISGIKTSLYLPHTYINLLHAVNRQKSYIQRTLAIELAPFKENRDGSLDDSDYSKILNYYAFGVPAILGTAFATLRGNALNEEERKALTYLGALTGLFDDFFDTKNLSEPEILDMINDPHKVKASNSAERIFLQFYNKALASTSNTEKLREAFYCVYLAQVESKKQLSGLNELDLQEITLKKGGVSLIFYRTALANALDERERELLYTLGGLMQLGNDIFDVYKDAQAGIRTMVNTTESIGKVRQYFCALFNETFQLAQKTNYKQSNINAFIRIISLGLSRCFVCLDQFKKLENSSGERFLPSLYSRADLICDMEKPRNIIKSITYHIRYCK